MYPIDAHTYRSKASNRRVRFLVLHYTAVNFNGSINALVNGTQVSAHYLVPDPSDPSFARAGFDAMRTFSLVDENERAWHAGVSGWAGRSNLNDTSIGIEIVNQASVSNGQLMFPPYHPQQVEALIQLCQAILQRYPDITPTQVVGHSDIAIGRKSDPGAAFPWQALHQAGIGAWYDEARKAHYQQRFAGCLPQLEVVLDKLRTYGYSFPTSPGPAQVRALLRAFQLHFRPGNFDGVLDAETAAIAFALVERYMP
ncbi:N-acetylmuramoyl-L-alanine amidase [Pseudomonas oryziphila]|uniref:N-acetylmuramoyl-L-alanine amidase n=1 Tax=Pseudomonas oryziphila TaxID=2894079 RepID=A0ABM7CV03_9PSED|nr:N-acetylmuramoyl-L-alanine amidase [Pseudomonas oryziphila]AZL75343.1 N-acetylmuramoyl-L-alanine amidase [Pseudomonas oryziphila]